MDITFTTAQNSSIKTKIFDVEHRDKP